MGVAEARAEAQRRYTKERQDRLEAEQAEAAEKQAAAEAKERTRDRDERRESARRDARLSYITRAKPLEATAVAANAAQAAFDAVSADPRATVERLFATFSAMQSAAAVHARLRAAVELFQFTVNNPDQPIPVRSIDSTPQPTFADVLSQAVAARAAVAASAAVVPPELFARANSEGDEAAKAVE